MSRPRRALHTYSKRREAFIRAPAEAPEIFSDYERAVVEAVFVECRTLRVAGEHFGRSIVAMHAQIRRARIALDWWLARRDAA